MQLLRLESAYEIRKDLEDAIRRMNPEVGIGFEKFNGWARMAQPILSLAIHEVVPPKIGEAQPQKVLAEISYSVSGLPNYLRKEWEELQKHDILQLVSFGPV